MVKMTHQGMRYLEDTVPSLSPSLYASICPSRVFLGVRSNTLPRPSVPAGAERCGGRGNGVGDTDLAAQDDEEGQRREQSITPFVFSRARFTVLTVATTVL